MPPWGAGADGSTFAVPGGSIVWACRDGSPPGAQRIAQLRQTRNLQPGCILDDTMQALPLPIQRPDNSFCETPSQRCLYESRIGRRAVQAQSRPPFEIPGTDPVRCRNPIAF